MISLNDIKLIERQKSLLSHIDIIILKKNEFKDRYEEALEIVEEHKIFMCSISESDKSFFKELIKNKWFNYDEMNNHQDIIQNWGMIVLNSNKHSVIELDKIIVDKKLKEFRET